MIAVIDYGVGNLFSLSSSLAYLGLENKITRSARELDEASHIILPGVGAFGDAMEKLASTGLVPELERQAENGKPLLGICLGMLPGSVCPLEPDLAAAGFSYKVPHIGWNSLHLVRPENPLMANTREGDFVYFVHSFYVKGCGDALVAGAEYGVTVPGAVARGNVYGCQFHPEKSGEAGLRILRAFAAL